MNPLAVEYSLPYLSASGTGPLAKFRENKIGNVARVQLHLEADILILESGHCELKILNTRFRKDRLFWIKLLEPNGLVGVPYRKTIHKAWRKG